MSTMMIAGMPGTRVAGAAAGDAGVMPEAELSPVPLGQRHGPWSDRRQSAGADGARTAKRRFRICNAFAPTRKISGRVLCTAYYESFFTVSCTF